MGRDDDGATDWRRKPGDRLLSVGDKWNIGDDDDQIVWAFGNS
jgi:hypothetical protein